MPNSAGETRFCFLIATEVSYPDGPPLDISLYGTDLGVARWVLRVDPRNGTDTLSSEAAVYIPSTGQQELSGFSHLPRRFTSNLPSGARQLLDTYVNQIVHTLERAKSAEQVRRRP